MLKQIITLLLLNLSLVYGQNPYSVKYGIDEGLPTSNIYSVMEDSSGFLWFGTDVGVLKYDGYEFVHYSTDDGLADNEVFQIYEDSDNRIWFLTLNGRLSYHKNGKFTNWRSDPLLEKASHPKMMVEAYNIEDDLHVLYRDGHISKMNLNTKELSDSHFNSPLYGHWQDTSGTYYLLIQSIIDETRSKRYSLDEQMDASISYRLVNYNGSKLFSVKDKLYEFDNGKIKEVLRLPGQGIIHLKSIENELWIGTRSGLYIKNGNQLDHYFKDQVVSNVLKDSRGNYWVTTLNNGIRYIPNMNIRYHKVSNTPSKINGVQKDDENNLWIGSEYGLFKLVPEIPSIPITAVNKQDYMKKVRYYHGTVFAIGNTVVSLIQPNSTKTLAFGANDFYFDGSSYVFSSSVVFKFPPSEIDEFPRQRADNVFKTEYLAKKTLMRKRTNVISSFKDNTLLFGTSTGLYCWKNDSVTPFNQNIEELNTSIQDLFYDKNKDKLLVASNSKGISIFNGKLLEHHISKKQGLSSNTCYSIKPYSDYYLIGTNKGLDKIQITDDTVTVENYSSMIGLKNEKVNDVEIIDSTLYLATDKGLLSYNLKSEAQNRMPPKLVIDSVLINDNIVNNLLDLKSNENNLSLSFTGISFSDYANIEYQYRMDGDNWNNTNNRNLVIKNMSSGNHSLEIRAKGQGKEWSQASLIELSISKPIWQTIPFVLITSLITASIVYYLIRRRFQTIEGAFDKERQLFREKQEKITLEKQMVDLEQKALRMQMNPHFIFNALNTIKGYYSGGNIKEANNYIGQFSTLLRLILENDQRLISLEKEIEIITLYIDLIKLRYSDVFDYEITVHSEIDSAEMAVPTLILQPLVENAIIHGLAPKESKGFLSIEFLIQNNKLVCWVRDNGIGYSTSMKKDVHGPRKSKALSLTRERIELENNNRDKSNFIIRDRNDGSGTEVIIKLPILKI